MTTHRDWEKMEQESTKLAVSSLEEQAKLEKQEAKLWVDVELPLSLDQVLAGLTKDELGLIRKQLQIKNLSKLSKQALVQELVRQIPVHLSDRIYYFDQPRYDFLDRLASVGYLSDFDWDNDQVEYFRRLGFVFSGLYKDQKVLFMPQEIKEAFQYIDKASLRSVVERNTEIIGLTHGALFYYGLLTFEELEGLMTKYIGEKIDFPHYHSLLFDASTYYGEFERHSIGYAHYRVLDLDWVRGEQQAKAKVDFYSFTKEQLIHAGTPDFVDQTPVYLSIREFMVKKCGIGQEQAEFILEEIFDGLQNGGDWNGMVAYVQQELQVEDMRRLKDLVDLLVDFTNHTRQWALKGYTPEELAFRERDKLRPVPTSSGEVIHFETKKKVGRNEPCPCGSGVKFKRCCGK